MKKMKFLIISVLILLAVSIYLIDYALDDNHTDCFDNKVNHILIWFIAIILSAFAVLCFVLFYSTKKEE